MLELIPLCTVTVTPAPAVDLGMTPSGRRLMVALSDSVWEGERFRARQRRDIADPYGATEMSMVSLNDKPAGVSQLGGMFYRDVTPQTYYVTMVSRRAFPNQFKTVAPRAGETFYIRLSTLPRQSCNLVLGIECSDDAFIVQVVAPEVGTREIQGLRLTAG